MTFEPRSAWTASGPKHPLQPWAPGNPKGIAWHYIGAKGHFTTRSHDDCLGWVARTERDEEGGVYAALSYNLCVCPHGHVIEGRGVQFQSGAQLHGNEDFVGVVLMRNTLDGLDDVMQRAATDARAYVLSHFPNATLQLGHRDVADNPTGTVCPGDAIAEWLRAGGARAGPASTMFTTSTTTMTAEEDDSDMATMIRPDSALTVGPYKGQQPTFMVDAAGNARFLTKEDVQFAMLLGAAPAVEFPRKVIEGFHLIERMDAK
ncbi:MAG: hypothetical protein JWL83_606 [Actinomycetia bacterium]|nr:hypothetical protein [Actinomycetes bacterium]